VAREDLAEVPQEAVAVAVALVGEDSQVEAQAETGKTII